MVPREVPLATTKPIPEQDSPSTDNLMHEQDPSQNEVYAVDFGSGALTSDQASALEKFTSAQAGLPCGWTMATQCKSRPRVQKLPRAERRFLRSLKVSQEASAAAEAHQPSPPDHDRFQRLVNYIQCLNLEC